MPFRLRKVPKKDLYWVVDDTGKHYSKEGLPEAKAREQQKALYAEGRKEGKGKHSKLARRLMRRNMEVGALIAAADVAAAEAEKLYQEAYATEDPVERLRLLSASKANRKLETDILEVAGEEEVNPALASAFKGHLPSGFPLLRPADKPLPGKSPLGKRPTGKGKRQMKGGAIPEDERQQLVDMIDEFVEDESKTDAEGWALFDPLYARTLEEYPEDNDLLAMWEAVSSATRRSPLTALRTLAKVLNKGLSGGQSGGQSLEERTKAGEQLSQADRLALAKERSGALKEKLAAMSPEERAKFEADRKDKMMRQKTRETAKRDAALAQKKAEEERFKEYEAARDAWNAEQRAKNEGVFGTLMKGVYALSDAVPTIASAIGLPPIVSKANEFARGLISGEAEQSLNQMARFGLPGAQYTGGAVPRIARDQLGRFLVMEGTKQLMALRTEAEAKAFIEDLLTARARAREMNPKVSHPPDEGYDAEVAGRLSHPAFNRITFGSGRFARFHDRSYF